MAVQVQATRQRIIRRPRLTSMLDESTAKVRMLIAPAGYGKTTLARQWLGEPERRGVWYRGGPASADVAALAAGIAEAASEVIPDAGKRMRDRLRATGHPEEDVDILAELFAEDVQQWPDDAWLAIDDYHFAMESVASEHFVDLLTQQTPIQLLITSRRRPSWASARRILYGELFEIDRRALAMEDAEAHRVLGRADAVSDELISRAHGWPAVLGLAAMTAGFVLPTEDLPLALHEYFADEVLHATEPHVARALTTLAFAPVVTASLGRALLGTNSTDVISVGIRLGVVTEHTPETFSIHPLLRDFLSTQFQDEIDRPHVASVIGDYFLDRAQWDNAFEVASRTSFGPLLKRTIERGLDPMLRSGRLATIQRWADVAVQAHLDLPIIDLAESEVAFRHAEHARAFVLASQAAERLEDSDLASRAHSRAGHSALMSSREQEALRHFRAAVGAAQSWDWRREALVGLYFAASELGETDADLALEELEATDESAPDGILRREVLRLTRAMRTGRGIADTVHAALPKLHLIDRATDPLGTSGFLHTLTTSLNLVARYADALKVGERQLKLASQYRLHLPVVHAYLNEAISYLGVADFGNSTRALGQVEKQLPPTGDAYLEATVRAIRCRLLTAQHRFADAIDLTDDNGSGITSPPLLAEYLASRALALACQGETTAAYQLAEQARGVFAASIELRVLSPCVGFVTALQQGAESEQNAAAREAWLASVETSNFDSFVCSYRAEPRLIEVLAHDDVARNGVAELLSRTSDEGVARSLGLPTRRHPRNEDSLLTPRERDVLRELERGSPNREIARRLFISESTVKVHLRHIYEKLGVRTRSELLAQRATRR